MTATAIKAWEHAAGVTFFDYQLKALEWAHSTETDIEVEPNTQRACLYFKTGAGKTLTALGMLAMWGYESCVAITPPSTYGDWITAGAKFGIDVQCMSHSKFRMKDTKLSRHKPVIADEMHMFGRNTGKGWGRLDTLARHLQAPLILASATPNYNDAERVYCIQHVLDPHSCKGGFLEFVYAHCDTEQNPYSMTPKVVGFKRHKDAADYLSSLPNVFYLPDDLVYKIEESWVRTPMPDAFERYGYNEREHKMIASGMEERHARVNLGLVNDKGFIHDHAMQPLLDILAVSGQVLIYCNHSTIAEALWFTLAKVRHDVGLVTGKTVPRKKKEQIQLFKDGTNTLLIGTASLATGTDGLDRACDTLVIFDDTDDDSLRRQLVGRIMPRGGVGDVSKKRVHRINLSS